MMESDNCDLEGRFLMGCILLDRQGHRIPPNQRMTSDFPVLHVGSVPRFDPKNWDFVVEGLIATPARLSFEEFMKLPKTGNVSDFHCVTGWSRLDNKWEGVAFKTIVGLVKPLKEAGYVTIVCEEGYTTSLPLAELLDDDVLLAFGFEGKALEPVHGGPLRLIVPKKYAYKSAKWVRKLRFTKEQELGFWEKRGYSNTADPWKEERYA